MNTQNLKLVIQALRFPKHKWSHGLVAKQPDGSCGYCAVAQAYAALGGELKDHTEAVLGKVGFSTFDCCDFVTHETDVKGLGWRLVDLNLQLSLPEIGDLLAKEYNL